MLISPRFDYMNNPWRQNLRRAGHVHAEVFLVLSLVALRHVDEAVLYNATKHFVRWAIPSAAILLTVAFFLSVLSPSATEPNALIYLAYGGAIVLAVGANHISDWADPQAKYLKCSAADWLLIWSNRRLVKSLRSKNAAIKVA